MDIYRACVCDRRSLADGEMRERGFWGGKTWKEQNKNVLNRVFLSPCNMRGRDKGRAE